MGGISQCGEPILPETDFSGEEVSTVVPSVAQGTGKATGVLIFSFAQISGFNTLGFLSQGETVATRGQSKPWWTRARALDPRSNGSSHCFRP